MTALPDVLAAVTLGPEDRLVLVTRDRIDAHMLAQAVRENAPDMAERVLVCNGFEDVLVLRATKAEGSTVGQCGDQRDESYIEYIGARDKRTKRTITRLCHLACGHTGMHSDGEATWANAGLYFCPTSGDVEDPRHGGFDVCCDRPDLHRPASDEGSEG